MPRFMKIRVFQERDRGDVLRLWEDCGLTRPWNDANKDIDRKLAFQPNLFFVGLDGATLIATAMAGYDGHRGSVFYLAVAPRLQGLSYGAALMTHVEHALVALGCPKLNILVRSSNESVLGFYDAIEYASEDVRCVGKRLIPDL